MALLLLATVSNEAVQAMDGCVCFAAVFTR